MGRRQGAPQIVLLGNALVLALVAALPLCLALLPAETLQCELGTGDLSAAALSSLDRDLQTQRLVPPTTVGAAPVAFLALLADAGPGSAMRALFDFDEEAVPLAPGTCTPGPTDATYRLLL